MTDKPRIKAPKCGACGSEDTKIYSVRPDGRRYYRCKRCGETNKFVPFEGRSR